MPFHQEVFTWKKIKYVELEAKMIESELTHLIRKNVLWPHIKDNDYSLPIDKNPETFHLGTFHKKQIISTRNISA